MAIPIKRRFRRQSKDEKKTREAAKKAKLAAEMPLLGHINDLRLMLVRMAIAVAIYSTIGLFFSEVILNFLVTPYGEVQVTGPTEGISTWIKIGLTFGIAFASPFLILEIFRFIGPGLTGRERFFVWLVVPGALFLFMLGATFAWFIMIPAAIGFLSQFLSNIFVTDWKANEYIPFVLSLVLWIGISFEMPLVSVFMAWLGFITPKMLLQGWRVAILAIALIAAAITPTVDPFNMLLVMAPLGVLYVLSIILSYFPYKARQRRLNA